MDEDNPTTEYGERLVGAGRFAAYRETSTRVDEQFGWLDARFPLSRKILEQELRHHVSDEAFKADRNLALLARFSPAKRSLRGAFDAGALARFTRRRAVLLQLSRFPALAELIAEVARAGGWRVGTGERLLLQVSPLKRLFFPLPLLPAILSSRRFKRVIRAVRNVGLSEMGANPVLLSELEEICRDEVAWISRQLACWRIRRVVLMEDNSSIAQLLCVAAQSLSIPVTVVAHGYIQDPKLTSICPINADKLLVWTEEQAEALVACLPPEQARRVEFVGFPKLLSARRHGDPHRLLYAAEPIFSTDQPALPWPALRQLFLALCDNGFDVILRLHPMDLMHAELSKATDLAECVTMSRCSLEEELMQADIVLGSNSSVLVEAAYAGRRAVQIEEGRRVHLERVEVMNLNSCAGLLPSPRRWRPVSASEDFDAARMAFISHFNAWLREA